MRTVTLWPSRPIGTRTPVIPSASTTCWSRSARSVSRASPRPVPPACSHSEPAGAPARGGGVLGREAGRQGRRLARPGQAGRGAREVRRGVFHRLPRILQHLLLVEHHHGRVAFALIVMVFDK